MSACNQKPKEKGNTMTTTQHTAGPWKVDDLCNTDMVYAANGLRVATAYCEGQDDQMPWEEVEANARLVAAAPHLLYALKKLVERDRSEAAESGFTDDEMTWLEDARRAIAKAKGGAS
jgi:hypothetical protein